MTFINSPLGNTKSICMESFYAFIDPMAPKNQAASSRSTSSRRRGRWSTPGIPPIVGAGQICIGEPNYGGLQDRPRPSAPERATGGFSRHACPINVGWISTRSTRGPDQ